MHNIRRTAVYAIRTYGGVGGGSCKASPYPDRTTLIPTITNFLTPLKSGNPYVDGPRFARAVQRG